MKKRFSDATFYTWRKKYGCMEAPEVALGRECPTQEAACRSHAG